MILVAAGLLLVGIAVWVAVAGPGGSRKPSTVPRKTSTGPVMPYGATVGLTRALQPGDCVRAVWATKRFQGLPVLGPVECRSASTEDLDGQVIKTYPANSLDDAHKDGGSRCKTLAAATVDAMPDAQSYALPPSEQAWASGIHNVACLIFDKTVALSGSVGAFRKPDTKVYLTNSSIGDCYNNQTTNDTITSHLTKCNTPHDEQVVGFVKAPDGMTYKAAFDAAIRLCENKYNPTYENATTTVYGLIGDEDGWKNGFHYLQCTVRRHDGKKLTSDLVTHTG
jgi:hypothetical protein